MSKKERPSRQELEAAVRTHGSQAEAAKALGIIPTTLNDWLRYGTESNSLYKEFTKEEIDQAIQNTANLTQAAAMLGVPRKTLYHWTTGVGKYGHFFSTSTVPTSKQRAKPIEECIPDTILNIEHISSYNRFVITSAQNNADVHEPFFHALQRYCDYNNALLIVLPVRYKNVTAYISGDDYKVKWPEVLKPYYLNHELKLNNSLVVLGDFKVQATARSPLSGIGPYAKQLSAIIGHAQLELQMVPTPLDDMPRKLMTTGSVSQKHYSSSKIGMLADFHHTLGAIVVETDGDLFWTRQINALEDGSFYDIDVQYFAHDTPSAGHRLSGLVCGDIHVDFADPDVLRGTFTAPNSIYQICHPENVYLHDVLDFHSANHHHRNDSFTRYAKHHAGMSNVKDELDRVVKFHNTNCKLVDTNWHYIASNHNDALTRWLNEADPKYDPENALLYHQFQVFMLENTKFGPSGTEVPNPLKYYMMPRIKNPQSTFFHSRGYKLMLFDIDMSQHGDAGANGARGSINSFANSGYKTVTGHGHAPGIVRGSYRVGTSSLLRLSYNQKGYSSWFQTHCFVYPNGKRSLIDLIDGRWRA